jgi:hypothetical protein
VFTQTVETNQLLFSTAKKGFKILTFLSDLDWKKKLTDSFYYTQVESLIKTTSVMLHHPKDN